jgi:hypothetical protein
MLIVDIPISIFLVADIPIGIGSTKCLGERAFIIMIAVAAANITELQRFSRPGDRIR